HLFEVRLACRARAAYSRTQIRSNRSSDMPPDTATVLPLRRHRTRSAQDDVRAGVRLELTRRGRMLVTLAAFGLGLLVALGALLVLDVPTALAGGETRQQATVTVEPGETL